MTCPVCLIIHWSSLVFSIRLQGINKRFELANKDHIFYTYKDTCIQNFILNFVVRGVANVYSFDFFLNYIEPTYSLQN